MRTNKKRICIILSVLMLICSIPVFSFVGFAADYQTGDMIEFGSYPQSLITDEILLAELETVGAEMEWKPMWYTSNVANEAYYYKDVSLDETEYRAIRFSRINSAAQSRYGYQTNTVYWFRFDPITWTVLDPESGLLIANAILDTQPYNHTIYDRQYADEDHLYYLNNYAHSTIRTWLNGAFLGTAFTEDETNVLVLREQDNSMPSMDDSYTVYACENTSDLVFLPSYEEVSNEEWFADKPSRVRGGTAYARALGVENYYNQTHEAAPENDFWFLRSPAQESTKQGYIGLAGHVYSGIDCYSFDVGICPAVYVDLDAYDSLNETDEPTTSIYDDLTFSFEDGILSVSGTGAIPSVTEAETAPFAAYAEECNVILIADGIESVQSNAFAGLENVDKLILNGSINIDAGAFSTNETLTIVICATAVQTASDAFSAETDILFFEPKAMPHDGDLPDNVSVIPYSFDEDTLTFDGNIYMDTYGLLDLMAVMCSYYAPIQYVSFTSYTSLDVPFYVFNKKEDAYVQAQNNTLEGVRFSVKVSGEEDWETITFNEFCTLADTHEISRFRLVADIETGEEVQEHDYEIKEEQPIVVIIKRVLKWITTLLNKFFSIFSKLK